MRKPFISLMMVVLAVTTGTQAQVGSSPTQLVHPILKDPSNRNAPTSLNRDPSLSGDDSPAHGSNHSRTLPPTSASPSQPGAVVPKIDGGLAASKLALLGTVNGLKGTLYVTNTSAHDITPSVQLMVCDDKGAKIGVTTKCGGALAPNADEKIVILATNMYATDLKLVSLTAKK